GIQGSSGSGCAGNCQKITTSNHRIFPLFFLFNKMDLWRQPDRRLPRDREEKSSRPSWADALQGREHKTSVVPPWFTAPSRATASTLRHRFCVRTAGRDNGRTRRSLRAL